MSIRNATIQRLFRQHFPGQSPIQLRKEESDALMKNIRQRLAGMKYVGAERSDRRHYYSQDPDHWIGEITIKEPGDSWDSTTTFDIKLNPQGQLHIEHYGLSAFISNLDEIVAFATECQDVVEHMIGVTARQGKVRNLKTQAILAQVKKLAKEEQFDFYSKTDSQKLILYVRLVEDSSVEIQIPFGKFEQVLPQLRDSIRALRQLTENDIKFKLSYREPSSWYGERWTLHESL